MMKVKGHCKSNGMDCSKIIGRRREGEERRKRKRRMIMRMMRRKKVYIEVETHCTCKQTYRLERLKNKKKMYHFANVILSNAVDNVGQ